MSHSQSDHEARRVPLMAPDVPAGFVPRPREHEKILGLLLDSGRQYPVAITTALQGAGGYGKTTLAAALCHDERVTNAFGDGILWATLGEDADGGTVLRELGKLYYALTREQPGFVDAAQASIELAEKLEALHCLIVIDDVWKAELLEPFLRGGKGCARLITTRLQPVASAAGGQPVPVDEMTADESARMLLQRVPEPRRPADLGPFKTLAARLGEWPLLLKLAAGALRSKLDRGEDLAGALDYVNRALDKRGVCAFDHKDSTQRDAAVANTIELSTELLQDEDRPRFLELAIFPEDTPIPLTTLQRLWGLDELDAEDAAQRLADHSLLDLDLARGTIALHDVMRAYMASRLPDPAGAHGRLLSAWGDFLSLPDAYAWRWAPWHLSKAGWTAELRRLLFDFDWILAKLKATDANALSADFDGLPEDADARLLQGGIRLSAHVLARDPGQLASQLTGRLLGLESPAIQALVARIAKWRGGAWWRPLNANLTAPGGPMLRILEGHSSLVNAVALTADGRRAVSASNDKTLRVWDLETGQSIRSLEGHSSSVNAVALTADGRRAVSASSDKTLRVWDLETGQSIRSLEGHSSSVNAVALTADGRRAVSASSDKTLRVWDLETGQSIRSLEGHSSFVTAVALTADGRRAVSASSDKTLRVWDLETGRSIRSLGGHSNAVTAVALTADGRRAVSASYDHSLRVWDLETGKSIRSLKGHSSYVTAVALTADGRRAVSASWDHTLRVWDLESGQSIRFLEGHSSYVNAVASTADGRRAVSASWDHTLRVWDLESGQSIRSLEGHSSSVTAVALTADGRRAVSASDDHTLRVWDLETGQSIRSLEGHSSFVTAVALTADGRRAVSASYDRTLRVWDLETGQSIRSLEGHSSTVTAVALFADGRRAVSASYDHTLRVWDLESGQSIRSLEGHSDAVTAVALSADGRRAVSASYDRTLRIWDLETGQSIRFLEGHSSFVTAVALTADGRRAVSASNDNTLRVWDLETGQSIRSLEGHSDWVNAVALTVDGGRAVSASDDNTLRVWDLETGQTIRSLEEHSSYVTALAITADGRRAVSASWDHTLRVWDLETGKTIHVAWADAELTCCAMTSLGSRIVAGESGGHVGVFTPLEAAEAPAATSLGRTLFLRRAVSDPPPMPSHSTPGGHDVFLAHNSRDKPSVLRVSESLKARGLRPWVDIDEIPPGRWFQDFLQAAIPKVKSAAIFLGPHGMGKWQAVELRSFITQCVEREIPVIPVLLPGVTDFPPEMIFLRELNGVKFQASVDEPLIIDRLAWGITGVKPGAPGAAP